MIGTKLLSVELMSMWELLKRVIARKLSISQQLEIDENLVVLLVEVVVTVVEVVSF